MAWYYGTFACGHEGRTNVVGPVKNRQWIADRRFEKLCEDCWEEHLEDRKEQEYQQALSNAKEMELPELHGSEKQVRWAVVLRQKFIDIVTKNGGWSEDQGLVEEVLNFTLNNYSKATWYIDGRYDFKELFVIAAKEYKDSVDEEKILEKQIEEEVLAEATVVPENQVKTGIVEINIKDSEIMVKYVRDEDLRTIVKGLGFGWDGRIKSWTRTIPGTAGTPQDRAGEIGNKILNAGFAVRILDHEARQKAVNGSFEPEHTRWIYSLIKGDYKGWLAIKWKGRDEELYKRARSLPGSRWHKPFVVVKPEFYTEVEEFAELYGFKLTAGAKKAIQEQKDIIENAAKINPVEVEEVEQEDGLQEILNSSDEVIDDLKDD